ncbi:uncharacterized protein LOC124679305 [Lolium rigidum]|uniref:uncharacterized protein LOC124679305 n=1 Tax=Lolium rigidum TaxID=89674 RepID=UPI001F5E0065|nr:uncharacterized protein LOC124679305 [Lolium rigidum]
MTSSSSSHHLDASSASSTPRAGARSTASSCSNGNGNGNHHHHPPPHAPSSRAQPQPQPHGGPCVRIMCSFGGRILPRPGDHRLRYVGGETRIVSVPRAASHAVLTAALARLAPALFAPGAPGPTLRYQLPEEDIDSLVSVSSDDDVDNLMCELDRVHGLAAADVKPPRLRLFLFASSPDHASSGAFGSVLSGTGDASIDQWFLDQLNAPAPSSLDRTRSDASSILSENTDYLTGIDAASASDDPNPAPPAAEQTKPDTETPHGDDDHDKPAPVLGAPLAPHFAETAPWPAPPPQYMQQPMYYYPPARPVHYVDAAGRQGSYMPGPVYHHMVAGGGNQDLYASGAVYGVPHPVQPYRQVIYRPPLAAADDYPAPVEGKPTEGASHSS